jgi:hypothetical protein
MHDAWCEASGWLLAEIRVGYLTDRYLKQLMAEAKQKTKYEFAKLSLQFLLESVFVIFVGSENSRAALMWGMAKCTIKGSVLLPQTVNRHPPRSPRRAAAAAAATGYLYLVSSTSYDSIVNRLAV